MALFGSAVVMSALLAANAGQIPQRPPDFSGTWVLEDSRMGGEPAPAGRGNAVKTGEVGGAVVNCGFECTVTQSADTLTVSRVAGQDGKKAPDGVVALDGRPMSGNTSAKWNGEKLVLTRALTPAYVVTQTLSLEAGKLVTVVSIGDNKVGPFTLTYSKK